MTTTATAPANPIATLDGPRAVRVSLYTGDVTVIADPATTAVDIYAATARHDLLDIRDLGDTVAIHMDRTDAEGPKIGLRVPRGTRVEITAHKADVTAVGEIELDVLNDEGSTRTYSVPTVRVNSTTGEVVIRKARTLRVHGGLSDVTVYGLDGNATIDTLTGNQAVHCVGHSVVNTRTFSGRVTVNAAPGVDVEHRARR